MGIIKDGRKRPDPQHPEEIESAPEAEELHEEAAVQDPDDE